MPSKLDYRLWMLDIRKKSKTYHLSSKIWRRRRPAFTLIELMIVIAIIGIISSIGFYGYQSSQKKARDAQRKSDLQMVKKALEHAKNDCLAGSYYPSNLVADDNPTLAYSTGANLLVWNDYLQVKPNDSNSSYYYQLAKSAKMSNVCPNSTDNQLTWGGIKFFVLRAKLEITSDPELTSSRTNCDTAINNVVYGVSNPTPASSDGYFYVCPD